MSERMDRCSRIDRIRSDRRALRQGAGRPSQQAGAALLAVLTLVAVLTASFLLDGLNDLPGRSLPRERQAGELLREARSALLGFAVSHPDTPGRMPYPDRSADNAWDGVSDCVNGTLGVPTGVALGFGRLPWQGDVGAATGCAGEATWLLDTTGPIFRDNGLWYAVSRNLLYRGQAAERAPINWALLDDDDPPYPWLTVRGADGNIVSDEVAVVIIHPGQPLDEVGVNGQNRLWVNDNPPGVAEYLESVTVGEGAGAITVDNGDANGCPDNDGACGGDDGEDFVMHPATETFNDRLTYITATELLQAVERRVLGEVVAALETYRSQYGAYPWASPFQDPQLLANDVTRLSGWAGQFSGLNVLLDPSADFISDGVNVGDRIEIVTDGSTGTVASVTSDIRLVISGLSGGWTNRVDVGDAYNIRPGSNGRTGTREGQLPVGEAEDFYAFSSGFTVDWESDPATRVADTSTPDDISTDVGELVELGDGGLPPQRQPSSAAVLNTIFDETQAAVWGEKGEVQVEAALDRFISDGVCRWAGQSTDLVCKGTRRNVDAEYTVDITDSDTGITSTFDVYRHYSFLLTFRGIVSRSDESNVKLHTVSSLDPLQFAPDAGFAELTIEVEERVASAAVYTTDYILYSLEYSPSAGTSARFRVSGVARDFESSVDWPAYFVENEWGRYVQFAVSDSSTQKDASVTGTAGAGSTGPVLEDLSQNFVDDFVKSGDFIRNLTQGWHAFVGTVDSSTRLTTGTASRSDLVGQADAPSTATTLVDLAADFVAGDVAVNDVVRNDTDGSNARVVAVVDANTLDLTTLGGGGDNTFEDGDQYSITRSNGATLQWSSGDEFAVWRWRCKTTESADDANPEADCLQITVPQKITASDTDGLQQQNAARALVIGSGRELAASQDRAAPSDCGAEPDALCDYFEDTNAQALDDEWLDFPELAPFNDEVRRVSTVN